VVLNYAHAAYKQPQQLTRLIWLFVQGYRPDLVVNIDGFNEVALAAENAQQGINPLYPSPPVWSAYLPNREGRLKWGMAIARVMVIREEMSELMAWADRWGLFRSSFSAPFVERRMVALEKERYAAQEALTSGTDTANQRPDRSKKGPAFDTDSGKVMAASIQCWLDSSRAMQTLCAERGVGYLHVLQPTYHDPGSKPLTQQELELNPGPPSWRPTVIRGYPLLRAGGVELAGEGVAFPDASAVFSETEQSLYYDGCHFRPPGSRILAEAIAPALLELVE
jgi:hypothetical protein